MPEHASEWRWVHLDSRAPESRAWLEEHCGTQSGQWTTSRLLEDDSLLQPREAHSDAHDALLVTVQAPMPANTEAVPSHFPSLRLWMCDRSRLAISTTHSAELLEILALAALAESSRLRNLGDVAVLLVDRMTQANVASCRDVESKLFQVKGSLQEAALSAGADAPVPWKQLTQLRARAVPLHYECIMQRRFATPQRDALDALKRFAGAPTQPFFSEGARYALREVALRQDTLVKSLDALCGTSQVLSDQLMAHVTWQGALSSQRLAYLGAFLSVLGTASVAIDMGVYAASHPALAALLGS